MQTNSGDTHFGGLTVTTKYAALNGETQITPFQQ